jgi:2',3'-cyclic-nucleotide 2'-phosphodiesterase (5'-nucleotidase family)
MNHKFIFVFLVVVLTGCATYVSEKDDVFGQNIRINEDLVKSDPKVAALISPYKDKLDAEMNEIIAVADVELIKATPESTMGNWFADMLMTEALLLDSRVSFTCQNRGGLRIGNINKGDITKRKIFELMWVAYQ